MLQRVKTTLTTNASGACTAYLGSKLRGYLVELIYRPGTLDTGADLTISTEQVVPEGQAAEAGTPILTKVNLGTGNSFLFPRAKATIANDATGGLTTVPSEPIPLVNDRIKIVVAQGGNTLTGTIEAIYDAETGNA